MADRFGIDAPATIVFSLFYAVFCTGFIYQSKEFSGAGLSPEIFLSYNDWIGSEELRFFNYHMKRTAGSMVLHSLLPAGYFLGYSYFTSIIDGNHSNMSDFWAHWPVFWNVLLVSIMMPLIATTTVWLWSLNGWERHPFIAKLKLYASNNTWRQVAADVETEFRRIDKISIRTNPLSKVVVTDNWIVMVGAWPWSLQLSHQSDVSLQLASSEHHRISTEGEIGGAQFLHIKVINRKPEHSSFIFRLNSLEYQNLQDKVTGTIGNFENIQVYKTVSERFVDVFKEQISENPRVSVTDELEPCIGCMAQTANVKIQRTCESSQEGGAAAGGGGADGAGEADACVNCYCRPMWCIDCMAKWFASRQDQSSPETWLGSKCPCPTCRSKFCVRDVRLIE
eukprot:GFUD01034010.1.p1 GENE.GFUD01034010.1~~GFUD01034010.1.p1  ORF type:complete len:413 (-),score=79.34 GFUD01034010.1:82-1263(-)